MSFFFKLIETKLEQNRFDIKMTFAIRPIPQPDRLLYQLLGATLTRNVLKYCFLSFSTFFVDYKCFSEIYHHIKTGKRNPIDKAL